MLPGVRRLWHLPRRDPYDLPGRGPERLARPAGARWSTTGPGRERLLVYYPGTLGGFADIGDRALGRHAWTRDLKGRAS
jgi:hypothetical protein